MTARVEKDVRYSRAHYRARWNHHAYMGRLAVRLIWVLLVPGIIFFAMLVSRMPPSVPEAKNGFAMMMTLVIFAVIAFLSIVRVEREAKLKGIAASVLYVKSDQGRTVYLLDKVGEEICHGSDFLPAPWGFPWSYSPVAPATGYDAVGIFTREGCRPEGSLPGGLTEAMTADLSQLEGDPNDALM